MGVAMQKIIILTFLILTFICSCSEQNKTASDWLEKEKALWDGKKYTDPKKAIEYLNNAIKLQPNNAETYTKRGGTYYNLGQYQRAIQDYNEAIRLKSNDVEAYNNRGYVYLMQDNKKLGCPDAQKACSMGLCIALKYAEGRGYCR